MTQSDQYRQAPGLIPDLRRPPIPGICLHCRRIRLVTRVLIHVSNGPARRHNRRMLQDPDDVDHQLPCSVIDT